MGDGRKRCASGWERSPRRSIREVEVASVDLRMFDELCGGGEVLQ